MAQPPFQWSGGVHVVGTSIWCDAARRRGTETTFVSRADAMERVTSGGQRIATEPTRRLLPPAARAGTLPTPFCRPFALGRARVELLPSGYMPGAAQLLVEVGGRRVLYAGAVNPGQAGALVEPAQVRACQAMVIDAPLAPLCRRLPPRAQVERQLVDAVSATLKSGRAAIVLAPARTAACEVAQLLKGRDLSVRVHSRVGASLRAIGRSAPVTLPAGPSPRDQASEVPSAIVWPIEARWARALTRLRGARLLYAGGEALDPGCAARFGVDAAFPLADTGDLAALLDHAEAAGAGDVYLLRGFTEEVAAAFARRGIRARPLGPPIQLAFA